MAGVDDIDIFGVPVTGSTRDRDLDRLEQMVRGRYIDPLEQQENGQKSGCAGS